MPNCSWAAVSRSDLGEVQNQSARHLMHAERGHPDLDYYGYIALQTTFNTCNHRPYSTQPKLCGITFLNVLNTSRTGICPICNGRKNSLLYLYTYVENQSITIRAAQIYKELANPAKYYCAEMVAQPLFSTVQSVSYDNTKSISYSV